MSNEGKFAMWVERRSKPIGELSFLATAQERFHMIAHHKDPFTTQIGQDLIEFLRRFCRGPSDPGEMATDTKSLGMVPGPLG